MSRPVVYHRWISDDPKGPTLLWVADLLNTGIAPVIVIPGESLSEHGRELAAALHYEGVPSGLISVLGSAPAGGGHVMLPFLASHFDAHTGILRALGQSARPSRLYLLFDLQGVDPRAAALVPGLAAPADDLAGFDDGPHPDAITSRLQGAVVRYGEHFPPIVTYQGGKVTAAEVAAAVAALNLPSPTNLTISTDRLRNRKRPLE